MSRVEPVRNRYVGHRYVPKIFGEWDKQNDYEGLSIVTHQGTSYTSKKRVPVGIDILNEEFWVVTGNYNAQIEQYRQDVRNLDKKLTGEMSDLDVKLTGEMSDLDGKLTGEMSDLDGRLTGEMSDLDGRLKGEMSDLDHKVSVYNDNVKNIYVDSNVLTNGDGSEEQPFNHPQKAFDYLNTLSEIVADGKWKINLKGNFKGGSRVRSLPKFRYPLYITGEVDNAGDPLTTIEMGDSNDNIGLWFEPSEVSNIFIENIHFKDFEIGYNGYGVLLKDGGNLFIDNCKASHCDIGFASVNQGRIQVVHSVIHDCFRGIMSQYSGTFTVGSQSNIEYNKNIIYNCGYGVQATRNSVGHVDNNEIYGCTYAGINNDMASRTNVMGNNIHDNEIGVLNQGASEWINNENTFTNNIVDFEHKGVSREGRLHSQTTNVLFSYPPFVPERETYTSTGSETPELLFGVDSGKRITKEQYKGRGKRINIKLVGRLDNQVGGSGQIQITGVGKNRENNNTFSETLGIMSFDDSIVNQGFEFEVDIKNTDILDKTRVFKTIMSEKTPVLQIGKVSRDIPGDIVPRVYFNTTTPGVKLNVYHIEISVAG